MNLSPLHKLPISVIVLTYNEEANVASCLSTIHAWAGELFVVDSGSEDKTVEMAQAYTANIFLKQGFYNYAYVYEDENGNKDFFQMEGYYYNTENDYTILVYYTPLGERYDRLIAVRSINSIRNR